MEEMVTRNDSLPKELSHLSSRTVYLGVSLRDMTQKQAARLCLAIDAPTCSLQLAACNLSLLPMTSYRKV